ncbi:hypothetical protein HHI36_013558 [Cryptolaemus montrouzieri]|uniref:Uncharacterized protein n=1 Tax=Cryptolaemus montrouzieri TaxID=559131 RepID=A0ABD2NI60_9CUCU
MSPRIPVSPLRYLCARHISNRLILLLCDEDRLTNEATRNYFLDVTYEVLQELLGNILNSTNLDAATRFNSLQVLLRNDVRKLNTGIFPHSYYGKILEVIISNGRGLHQLNLKGVWARDHPELLRDLVSSLSNLRILIIPHIANDDILQCIGGCKNLNTLDISGEASFTTYGLNCLRNKNLYILSLGNYGKKEICEGNSDDIPLVSSIISNLPSLKNIRTYSFTGCSLSILYQSRLCSLTNLTYLHDTGTTNEVLDAIIELCPFLESIHLESPEQGVVLRLSKFKRLQCLKLVKSSNIELTEYLNNHGSNLEILKVNHNKSERLDVTTIATEIAKIHTIEFYQMSLSFSNPEVFFMSLSNLEILYCDITDNGMKQILSNSPFLKKAVFGCVINFSDGDIFRLCADCDFLHLEDLWFSCAKKLTIISVELLMGHCPNLRTIGQLGGWDITSQEIEFFRNLLHFSNIDLTLFD